MNNRTINILIVIAVFGIFLSFLSSIYASELNLTINSAFKLNSENYSADAYLITNDSASSGFDFYDFSSEPIQNNETRFFSWCSLYGLSLTSRTWNNCSFTIDSWPKSTRTFYFIFRFYPNLVVTGANLNLSWDTSAFASEYSASLADYGEDYTFSSAGLVGSSVDMKTLSSYFTETEDYLRQSSGVWRFFTLTLTYTTPNGPTINPPEGPGSCVPKCAGKECGDNGCNGLCGRCSSGKTCENNICIIPNCTSVCELESAVVCGTPLKDSTCDSSICSDKKGRLCSVGEVCNNNTWTCEKCEDSCSSLGFECGTHELCGISTYCGGCLNDETCSSSGKCGTCTPSCEDKACGDDGCGGTCGSCGNGYVCSLGNCEEGEIINGSMCGEWGECQAEYDIEDIISGGGITGLKTRTCIDLTTRLVNEIQEKECFLKEDLTIINRVWCGETYTEMVDKFGRVLSRMKPSLGGKYVRVDLNTNGEGYCSYCFDGVKNFDEENIDCGGSCMSCVKKDQYIQSKDVGIFNIPAAYLSKSYILYVLIFILLIALLIEYFLIRKVSHYVKPRVIPRTEDAFLREYHYLKKHFG